jgi:hypothetical protein
MATGLLVVFPMCTLTACKLFSPLYFLIRHLGIEIDSFRFFLSYDPILCHFLLCNFILSLEKDKHYTIRCSPHSMHRL